LAKIRAGCAVPAGWRRRLFTRPCCVAIGLLSPPPQKTSRLDASNGLATAPFFSGQPAALRDAPRGQSKLKTKTAQPAVRDHHPASRRWYLIKAPGLSPARGLEVRLGAHAPFLPLLLGDWCCDSCCHSSAAVLISHYLARVKSYVPCQGEGSRRAWVCAPSSSYWNSGT
jgi:hypothetical protein